MEGALVMLPIVVLVVGSTDFLLGLFVRNTLQNAVREGCRYAVTGRTAAGLGQTNSIQKVVREQSLGFLRDDSQVTVRYFDKDGLGLMAGSGANSGGNIVQVSITDYRWRWIVPRLLGAGEALSINVSSSDVLEPSPGGIPPAL
jgi:hypothetical protein